MPIKRALTELGFENLNIVKAQEKPDGNFPTASYPNPEDKSVFNIALEMALYYKEEGLTLYEALIKLPKSNVLKYILEDDSWFVVRPSGTEPKMKIYLAIKGNGLEDSAEKLTRFKESVMTIVNEKLV